MPRVRLDTLLVNRGLSPSRSRAADSIRRGTVTVAGRIVRKPGELVDTGAEISIDDEATGLVSRAGLKLVAALDAFAVDPAGCHCLDLGASTGGFTQVLLQRGAAHVTAVDVGHGQLAPELAADPRVTSREGLDARDLTAAHLVAPPELITADLAFIGLEKALPTALALAAPGAVLIALIKPQFEAGPGHVGKGGIVRDPAVHDAVCARVTTWLEGRGWDVNGLIPSPIEGGGGNREFLVGARRYS